MKDFAWHHEKKPALLRFLYRREPKRSGVEVMAAWRRAIELSLGDEDTAKLNSIAQVGSSEDDRDGVARPIDEQLLAGQMRLPHR
jgi:hypothetical protein